MKLTETEKRIIHILQGDMPVIPEPFAYLADRLNLTEDEVIDTVASLKQRGIIRRLGETLRHQQSGYSSNVMVAWKIDADKIEETGRKMASFRMVSHCYHRETRPEWPYNLYTMVHGTSPDDCKNTVAEMAEQTGESDYQMLFSRQELKKTSMRYFE